MTQNELFEKFVNNLIGQGAFRIAEEEFGVNPDDFKGKTAREVAVECANIEFANSFK